MRTFPDYKPKYGARPNVQFRVLRAQFGDGYSQRGQDGLNNRLDDWPLTFERPWNDIVEIMQFINDHAGHKAFLWSPPDETEDTFTCTSYAGPAEIGGGWFSLTTTFNREFDL